jgi:hypothetical protein
MAHSDTTGADRARLVLAGIRIINGTLALVAPRFLIGRVQAGDPPAPAAVYAFRMFGIRTVLIGRDLVRDEGPARANAVAEAPLIHACDTATATLLTLTRQVRVRNGLPLIAISALNTVLAVVASRHAHDGGRHR